MEETHEVAGFLGSEVKQEFILNYSSQNSSNISQIVKGGVGVGGISTNKEGNHRTMFDPER